MVIKLKDMQKRYMAYVDEELDKLSHGEDRLRYLQEYLLEKQEVFQIYYGDLINKTDDADKLKAYLKRLTADLYWLFNQREEDLTYD